MGSARENQIQVLLVNNHCWKITDKPWCCLQKCKAAQAIEIHCIPNLAIRRRNTPSFIYTANENNPKTTNHRGAEWAFQFISTRHQELKTSWFLCWVPQAIVFIYISPWSEVRADQCYGRPWLFFPDSYNYYSPGDSFSQSGHPLTQPATRIHFKTNKHQLSSPLLLLLLPQPRNIFTPPLQKDISHYCWRHNHIISTISPSPPRQR